MRKSTKMLLGFVILTFATLFLMFLVFRGGSGKIPELPTYAGAMNLQEQTLNNGRTRIVTFQIKEIITKVSLTYIKKLTDVGWYDRVMTSGNKFGSYYMEYIDKSKDINLFGLHLTGSDCPNYLLYLNATEDAQQVTTVTVRQELGTCTR